MSFTYRTLVVFIVNLLIASILFVFNAEESEATEIKLDIVALGDSYTSGTGGLNYFGTSGCYKSHNNYSEVFANKISGIDVTYRNLACHGAVISDVYGQINGLTTREAMAVDLVLLSIGGNDAGFESIVKQCLVDLTNSFENCVKSIANAASMAQTIADDTRALLNHLSNKMPNAKIVLVGYPNIIDDGPGDCAYVLSVPGWDFHAGTAILQLAYQLEADQLHTIDVLNSNKPGRFEFVTLKALFDGHEQCGDKALWIRGSFDTTITGEWWHPNVEGYKAIANHLYGLGIYRGEEDIFSYGNLPFACNVVAPYASTYDTMSDGTRSWTHGLAIDMPMPEGTQIVAATSGTARVRFSTGYGNYVDILGSDGVTHRTAHMQNTGLVQDGVNVYKGQVIGRVGTTGNTTGPHVHYEQLVNGEMRTVVFDGPALEWGPNISSYGDRFTTHSLESRNCPSGGGTTTINTTSATDELIIYREGSGRYTVHDVGTNGSQTVVGQGTWSSGWDIIVELEIDGDAYSEVLFYNSEYSSTRGRVSVYNTASTGLGSHLWAAAWSKGWTHVVPVDLDGDDKDELIVYNASTGRYFFLDVRSDGSMRELSTGTWSVGWQSIVAVELGGSRGEEVLFYKPGTSRGVAKVYSTSNTALNTKLNQIAWVNGWEIIIPVDIDNNGNDELVLYRPTDGRYFLLDMSSSGGPSVLDTGTWSKGWDIIAAIEVDGDKYSEILFYDADATATRGKVKFYNMSMSGIHGLFAEYDWSLGWTEIVSVRLPQR